MPAQEPRGFVWPHPCSAAAKAWPTLQLTPITPTILNSLSEHRRDCPICTIEFAPDNFVTIFSCCSTAAHVTCLSAYLNTPPHDRLNAGREECIWCRTKITVGRRLNRVVDPGPCRAWTEQQNFEVPKDLQSKTWPLVIDVSPRVIDPRPRAVHRAPPAPNIQRESDDNPPRLTYFPSNTTSVPDNAARPNFFIWPQAYYTRSEIDGITSRSIAAPVPDDAARPRVLFPPPQNHAPREEPDGMVAEHEAEMAAAARAADYPHAALIEEYLLQQPEQRDLFIQDGMIPPNPDPGQPENDVSERLAPALNGGPVQEPNNQEAFPFHRQFERPARPDWFERLDWHGRERERQQASTWDFSILPDGYFDLPGLGARTDDDLDSLAAEVGSPGGPVQPQQPYLQALLAGSVQEVSDRYAELLDGMSAA
ncbi:uncharacterized protein AB675_3455 [Cyphellophora attinorum]|uniref:Uncharacterized protein n=1 Tax=Cyphellophora attinorum TaxID=1664694 RepID=A0A0N1NYC7_9EURO|nr:uncharacterized protein AB675_3455 [Phialophora attinorum]KPI39565.1 hypothetical protein AB675_3455 [Phialophora attinorum]